MTNPWQDIIEQQHTLTPDNYSDSTAYFMPLEQLGVLHISGDEAQGFLQNLLTNDVADLAINQAQLSGFCNAKGRLFALFQLIRRKDYYQIILPRLMVTLLQQRLGMYVLRSKVTISNESDNLVCIGLTSPNNNYADSLDLSNDLYLQNEQQNCCLCVVSHEQASNLLHTLQEQQWQLASNKVWDLLDIKAGIPTILPETKEKFTPQQVNLDLIDGVSFKKGCYPGQEVVARLHYLGKPSRRMSIAEANATELPANGDEVKTKAGDIAGHVVRSQLNDKNTIQLLVSLKLTEQDSALFISDTVELKLITN
ncbi:MAG: folate-binding protein [Methylophaga sp.]|nr:folate-binding protein [Methylophaga sp.]